MTAEEILLEEKVPIWSDSRADREASEFFTLIPSDEWYLTTGNGFPAPLYTLFKILWLRRRRPEIFARAKVILGTKDYVNFDPLGELRRTIPTLWARACTTCGRVIIPTISWPLPAWIDPFSPNRSNPPRLSAR